MPTSVKSPTKFIVRCIAERKDDVWQAFSLEFGLAAQAESVREVKDKLDSMIASYLEDALVGADREHARELLGRKAHWTVYARYHIYSIRLKFATIMDSPKDTELFDEPMRLVPQSCI